MNFDFGIIELLFVISVFILTLRQLNKISDKNNKEYNSTQEAVEIVVARSEIINNQIFIWDKKTNKFLGQGSSVEDTIKKFLNNNPNKRIVFEVNE